MRRPDPAAAQRLDQLADLLHSLLFQIVGLGFPGWRLPFVDQLADLRDRVLLRWVGVPLQQ